MKLWLYAGLTGGIVATLAVTYFLGVSAGKAKTQTRWDAAVIAQDVLEAEERARTAKEVDEKNAALLASEAALQALNAEKNLLRDENAQLQARKPLVRTIRIPVDSDRVCHYPAVSEFVRVWNADAQGSSAVRPAGETSAD